MSKLEDITNRGGRFQKSPNRPVIGRRDGRGMIPPINDDQGDRIVLIFCFELKLALTMQNMQGVPDQEPSKFLCGVDFVLPGALPLFQTTMSHIHTR